MGIVNRAGKGGGAPTTGVGSPVQNLDIDGWYYWGSNDGTPVLPLAGDWRTQEQAHATIPSLTVQISQRYNGGWETIETLGGSLNVDSFNLTDGHSGFGYQHDVMQPSIPLINIGPDLGGPTIGNMVSSPGLLSSASAKIIKHDTDTTTILKQPLEDATLQLLLDADQGFYYHEFSVTETETFIEQGVSIWVDAASDVTDAMIWTGNKLPDGAESVNNVSEQAFKAGMGHVATIGKNVIDWSKKYPLMEGVTHMGFIASNKPIIINGSVISSTFVPKFEVRQHNVDLHSIGAWPKWTAKTFAIGDWIIEGFDSYPGNPKVYKCKAAGAQSGTFAGNAASWTEVGEIPAVLVYKGGISVADFNALTSAGPGDFYRIGVAGTLTGGQPAVVGDQVIVGDVVSSTITVADFDYFPNQESGVVIPPYSAKTWTAGDAIYQDGQVYYAIRSGAQTGTFASNKDAEWSHFPDIDNKIKFDADGVHDFGTSSRRAAKVFVEHGIYCESSGRARYEITTTDTNVNSPDGKTSVDVTDTAVRFKLNDSTRTIIDAASTRIYSPDFTKSIVITNSGIEVKGIIQATENTFSIKDTTGQDRFYQSLFSTKMISWDGNDVLEMSNGKITINDKDIAIIPSYLTLLNSRGLATFTVGEQCLEDGILYACNRTGIQFGGPTFAGNSADWTRIGLSGVVTPNTASYGFEVDSFNGDNGLPSTHSDWAENVTAPATVILTDRLMGGVTRPAVTINDDGGGMANIELPITAAELTNANANGAVLSGTSALDPINGYDGGYVFVVAAAADNPLATGSRRMGVRFFADGGVMRFQAYQGVQLHISDIVLGDSFEWEFHVPVGFGLSKFYVNGVEVLNDVPFDTIVTSTSFVSVQSGSSSGQNRISYHTDVAWTVYTDNGTMTLNAADFVGSTVMEVSTLAIRDRNYTVTLGADVDLFTVRDKLKLISLSEGGTFTLTSAGNSTGAVTFNGSTSFVTPALIGAGDSHTFHIMDETGNAWLDSAETHPADDGSSHGFIDQDVSVAASPTFASITTDNVALKVKRLTGTMPAGTGQLIDVAHGLDATKIEGFSVLVNNGASKMPPNMDVTLNNNTYGAHVQSTDFIRLQMKSGDDSSILGGAFTILITYEE